MRKILLMAKRDYIESIQTKAFLIGLVVAPLLFGGGFLGHRDAEEAARPAR